MAFTGHGHHIPGTILIQNSGEESRNVARCGGPRLCPRCAADVKDFQDQSKPLVPMNVPDDFVAKAKHLLVHYVDSHHAGGEKQAFEVYVVWFVKVLQHWKALVCTDQPDGKYYELTYNGDRRETYIDEYVKIKNTVVPD